MPRSGESRVKFGNLDVVGFALNGARSAKDAHAASFRYFANFLYRRSNHAKHSSRWVDVWKVVLLNGAQSLSRSSVAGKDYELAALIEKIFHCLQREAIHNVE